MNYKCEQLLMLVFQLLVSIMGSTVFGQGSQHVPSCSQRGAVRLVNGSISSIGRVEICSYDANGGLVWGTLCHRHWNNTDTRIVCHELGYTELGPKLACTSACFGSGNGPIFIKENDNCNILTSTCIRLAENNECDHSMDTGVICEIPLQGMQCAAVAREVQFPQTQQCTQKITQCTRMAGGLGIIASLMSLGLMGVVLGWVWSCKRKKRSSTIRETAQRDDIPHHETSEEIMKNPAYKTTVHSEACQSVEYGTIDHQDSQPPPPTSSPDQTPSILYDNIIDNPPRSWRVEGEHRVRDAQDTSQHTVRLPREEEVEANEVQISYV